MFLVHLSDLSLIPAGDSTTRVIRSNLRAVYAPVWNQYTYSDDMWRLSLLLPGTELIDKLAVNQSRTELAVVCRI